jgi:hypothetical protein
VDDLESRLAADRTSLRSAFIASFSSSTLPSSSSFLRTSSSFSPAPVVVGKLKFPRDFHHRATFVGDRRLTSPNATDAIGSSYAGVISKVDPDDTKTELFVASEDMGVNGGVPTWILEHPTGGWSEDDHYKFVVVSALTLFPFKYFYRFIFDIVVYFAVGMGSESRTGARCINTPSALAGSIWFFEGWFYGVRYQTAGDKYRNLYH